MPTDEMLVERFTEILNLTMMEEGEIETTYGLKAGEGQAEAYKKGTISSLCRTSISELNAGIANKNALEAKN
jgi:hypothetical protein